MKYATVISLGILLAACGSEKEPARDKTDAAGPPDTAIVASESRAGASAQDFAACAVCHMPTGAGVKGAFPPVRNRTAAIAALDGGRQYLITVAKFGMSGTIEVAGDRYAGVMPGQGALMSDQALAAAINYSVFELNDGARPTFEPFTVEEIQAVSAAVDQPGLATAGKLRQELVTRYGDEWP